MPDWAAVKNDFLAGGMTQRALARKYGVSPAAVNKRMKSEHWGEQRAILVNKSEQAICDKIVEAESEIAAIKARMRLRWWQRQERTLNRIIEQEESGRLKCADARKEMQNFVDLMAIEPKEDKTDEAQLARAAEILGGVESAIE